MDSRKLYVRGLTGLFVLALVLFSLEFLLEWQRLGRPGPEALSWAGVNNAKLVDILSPVALAAAEAHLLAQDRLQHIGTIILKAIDRADRSVAREGIWLLKRLLDDYGECKGRLPAAWFVVERKDFAGLSAEALALVNKDRTW